MVRGPAVNTYPFVHPGIDTRIESFGTGLFSCARTDDATATMATRTMVFMGPFYVWRHRDTVWRVRDTYAIGRRGELQVGRAAAGRSPIGSCTQVTMSIPAAS